MKANSYLEQSIRMFLQTAAQVYLKDKEGRQFLFRFVAALQAGDKLRKNYEQAGVHVPHFLFASVTSQCNLRCAGCYARAGGTCGDTTVDREMTIDDWARIFREAANIGVSFIMMVGGEPLLRRDILALATTFKTMAFPIFTNATLIDDAYARYFHNERNLTPVLSIEGNAEETDLRRGKGVGAKTEHAMALLKQHNVLYGVSITVTKKTLHIVTSESFITSLRQKGVCIVFYMSYVPIELGTEHLMLSTADLETVDKRVRALRKQFPTMSLVAVPGDEKYMGGCLSAGRIFFHINVFGGTEPCPFSPYSGINIKNSTILDAVQSPFFKQVRKITRQAAEEGYTGCPLYREKAKVQQLSESLMENLFDVM